MQAIRPPHQPVQSDSGEERGNYGQDGETYNVHKDHVANVLWELDKTPWLESRLRNELDAVKFPGPDIVIKFEGVGFHEIKYSTHQGRNIVTTSRLNTPYEPIFAPEPVLEDGAVQAIFHTRPQIVLFTTPVCVKVNVGTIIGKLKSLGTTDDMHRLPLIQLLAHLVIKWDIRSLDFSPTEFPEPATDISEHQKLPPFQSDIRLPSQRGTYDVQPAKSHYRIAWFRNAPDVWFEDVPGILRYFKSLAKRDCYTHRPDFTNLSIHMIPGEPQILKSLFLFSNAESLRDFSARVGSGSIDRLEEIEIASSLRMHLLAQVLDDGACFLKQASERINQTKYKGIRRPQRLDVEFLMLLEDYLRELPSVLDGAIANMRELSPEHLDARTSWCNDRKLDIQYLKKKSAVLRKEANSVKGVLVSHIGILETIQMAKLTILASVFIPLSFTASFFGMNLQPIIGGSTSLSLHYFWAVGITLTIVTIVLPFSFGPLVSLLIRLETWKHSNIANAAIVLILGLIEAFVSILPFSIVYCCILGMLARNFKRKWMGRARGKDLRPIVKDGLILCFYLVLELLYASVIAQSCPGHWTVLPEMSILVLIFLYQPVQRFYVASLLDRFRKRKE